MQKSDRIIGRQTGDKPGPLLIAIAGVHGNELSGVRAIDLVLKMIEVEPITNPDFSFSGRIVGLRGNLQALEEGVRYIERDLNRSWRPEIVDRVMSSDPNQLEAEDLEMYEMLQAVWREIEDYPAEEVVILDLHTTTAKGGIFTIPSLDARSIEIALSIKAPVITGFLEGIQGTTMHYFNSENLHVPISAVVFESGQHIEPLSMNRAIAAIINCLKCIGSIDEKEVENEHLLILQRFSVDLPRISKLVQIHHIEPIDRFRMHAGYDNFQKVKKGEVLGTDKDGDVYSEFDGRILMPLYQSQGEDGFFIIQEVVPYDNLIHNMDNLLEVL